MPEVIHQSSERSGIGPQIRAILQRRFLLLFLFLIVSLGLYPFAETNPRVYFAFRIIGAMIVLLSVYAIGFRRGILILGLLLAVPRLLQHFLALRAGFSVAGVLSIILSFTFDVFVIVVMLRRVFLKDNPNAETIFGALSIYLLIGYGFASVYGMISSLQPHAFYLEPAVNNHSVPNRFDFLYYSFGAMTTLGSSGITAISSKARSLAVLQSILGTFYLAVLIARLMTAYRSLSDDRKD
jgi:uncharacterized membrane protein